jgi:hypothetical protein
MPLINVKLIEDVFTPDQKREIVERLTDAMVSSKARTCARSPGSSSRRLQAATGALAASR